jgi:hypothetical protein
MLLAQLGKTTAAGSTLRQPGKQIYGPARLLRPEAWAIDADNDSTFDLELLHLLPQRVVDDTQARHGMNDPGLLGIETGDALARGGVLSVAERRGRHAEFVMPYAPSTQA